MTASAPLTPAMLRVSLWRRLAAMLYDTIALFGVLFVAGALVLAVRGGAPVEPSTPWFTLYLAFAAWAYLAYSWRRGRTLGMQSWKIRIIDARTGQPPDWRQTLLRYAVAGLSAGVAGIGFWRCLWHPEGAAWHDSLSGTALVRDYRPRPSGK